MSERYSSTKIIRCNSCGHVSISVGCCPRVSTVDSSSDKTPATKSNAVTPSSNSRAKDTPTSAAPPKSNGTTKKKFSFLDALDGKLDGNRNSLTLSGDFIPLSSPPLSGVSSSPAASAAAVDLIALERANKKRRKLEGKTEVQLGGKGPAVGLSSAQSRGPASVFAFGGGRAAASLSEKTSSNNGSAVNKATVQSAAGLGSLQSIFAKKK